ncbi:SIR2 family protein [Hymenobacter armeniacus]|uniref:SIR2 family protein n=1 Tax=Hymenobacter armeniacus TaxID=2771358 RepID=A0ABR8JQY5_9BACT|nr:SIR2 family protein [Hymenobacter armeniacus]MBD2722213.1 SIR2 family protein [Hymenobacter armeniacus]
MKASYGKEETSLVNPKAWCFIFYVQKLQQEAIFLTESVNLLIMSDQPFFSDLHHVAYLRKRLWMRRTTGRAAVMIGAGFSRNGVPQVAGARPFPLWRQLVELMFDGLRPGHPDPVERNKLIDQAASGTGALTMALEYEATFGRSALDNLIIGAIPNDEHSPGELHRKLLSLPWADIFTVNYDTLLERTRAQVYNRRYEVVVHLSDLPTTTQPRIIKLHGSLPATKPFIITEEDFRRYPRQFAPFVNTVQQGMMENDFVLLGFSGDDPNFLAWLGWIRDELLTVRPQVYLCGVLDLTTAQRLVLEKRGVTPIDLGTLFTAAAYPDNGGQRRSDAIQWFLESLENGRGALVPLSWPHFPHLDEAGVSPKSPKIGPAQISVLAPELPGYEVEDWMLKADTTEARNACLRALLDRWELNRGAYPGWLVLPRANRESLISRTENWRSPLIKWIADLPLAQQLRPLAELAWRMEKGLLVFESKTEVKLFRKFVKQVPIPGKPAERDYWATVAFFLLRQMRYDYDHKSFMELLAHLEPLTAAAPSYRAWRCWEAASERLEHMDADSARTWLNRWPDVQDNPAWDLRRAGLWAELDELDTAERYAAQALTSARARQPAGRIRIDMLSVEEAATWRLTQIREEKEFRNLSEEPRENRPRVSPDEWDRQLLFKEYNCASDEVGDLYDIIKGPVPEFQPAAYEEIAPHTGRRSYGRRMATMFSVKWVQPALDIPAIFEESGQPMRLGFGSYKELAAAVRWIFDVAPLRALGVMVRTRNNELLDVFLDPARVAEIEEDSLLALLEPAMHTLEASLSTDERNHSDRERDNVKLALRLVGRGAFRLNEEARARALQLAIRVWAVWPRGLTNRPSHDWQLYSEFTAGIIGSLTKATVLEVLPGLLLTAPEPEFTAGPFERIDPDLLPLRQSPEHVRSSITTLLTWLDGNKIHRRAAIRRLFFLNSLGWLAMDEQQQFARALWAPVVEKGIPQMDNVPRAWRLLTLPAPEGISATERVKQYLLGFTSRKAPTDQALLGAFVIRNERELRYFLNNTALSTASGFDELPPRYHVPQQWIQWSKSEALLMLQTVIDYFELVKTDLLEIEAQYRGKRPSRSNVSGFDFDSISLFLRRVVLPALTIEDEEVLLRIEKFILELLETRMAGRAALPALLAKLAEPEAKREEYTSLIRLGLLSYTNADAVADGAEAVYCWVASVVNHALDSPYHPLLSELLLRLRMRGLPNTTSVAQWVLRLLNDAPNVLWPKYAEPLSLALLTLLDETNEPTWIDRLLARRPTEREQLFQRPTLLAQAAEMAGLISVFNRKHPVEVAVVMLAKWKERIATSPYPDVKRAWEKGRQNSSTDRKPPKGRKFAS